MITIILFALGISLGSIGGVLTKFGAHDIGSIKIADLPGILNLFLKMMMSWKIVLGLFLYLSSAVIWVYLLTKLDISYVQPILALTYVITPLLAILFLGEKVPNLRWIGIIVIIIGVYIVSKTAVK